MLTLAAAQSIIAHTLAHGHEAKFKTLGVVVLDARAAWPRRCRRTPTAPAETVPA